jgi:putative two-component system response regulator
MEKPAVICVDDEKMILDSLRLLFKADSELNIKLILAESGEEALEVASEIHKENTEIAVVISDHLMPGMKGDEFLIRLHRLSPKTMNIMLTGQAGVDAVGNAINKAALYRYITKPWESTDLLMTVKEALKKYNKDKQIEELSMRIEKLNIAMIQALENANQLNDDCTGNHIRRVSDYAALIAKRSGQDPIFTKQLKIYATMHDIGKIGIPGEILNKPGRFTDEEFKVMQQHVQYGAKILDSPEIDQMARNIALYHHEKWDGTGYLSGLAGEEIPFEARIVAIADVFDALTTERPYKKAFPVEEAYSIILKQKGIQFDPHLVDVFSGCYHELLKISNDQ